MGNKPKKLKYITLKEAAKISGYSSDHVGYLIREGKVAGKQIYCNVAWMTTKEEIIRYKQQKDKGGKNKVLQEKTRKIKAGIAAEMEIIKLFFKSSKYLLPVVIILISSFTLLIIYFFSTMPYTQKPQQEILPADTAEVESHITY